GHLSRRGTAKVRTWLRSPELSLRGTNRGLERRLAAARFLPRLGKKLVTDAGGQLMGRANVLLHRFGKARVAKSEFGRQEDSGDRASDLLPQRFARGAVGPSTFLAETSQSRPQLVRHAAPGTDPRVKDHGHGGTQVFPQLSGRAGIRFQKRFFDDDCGDVM